MYLIPLAKILQNYPLDPPPPLEKVFDGQLMSCYKYNLDVSLRF